MSAKVKLMDRRYFLRDEMKIEEELQGISDENKSKKYDTGKIEVLRERYKTLIRNGYISLTDVEEIQEKNHKLIKDNESFKKELDLLKKKYKKLDEECKEQSKLAGEYLKEKNIYKSQKEEFLEENLHLQKKISSITEEQLEVYKTLSEEKDKNEILIKANNDLLADNERLEKIIEKLEKDLESFHSSVSFIPEERKSILDRLMFWKR